MNAAWRGRRAGSTRRCLASACLLAATLLVCVPVASGARQAWQSAQVSEQRQVDRRPLRQIRQIRALTSDQAAQSLPVRLAGVVTAISGYKKSFFFQDSTAGIDVEGNTNAALQVGDRVELAGVVGPGYFAPIVVAKDVRVVGRGRQPPARRVHFADMMGGEQDSQWIAAQGVVRSARPSKVYGRESLILALDLGGATMRVLLQEFKPQDAALLVDATVRFRGVCISDFNDRRQFVGLGLIVSSRGDMDILQAAQPDPFAAPATPIRNALRFGQARHRLKIVGVATYQLPGRYLYLQQGGDGIRVQTASTEIVKPGSEVEAVGFPVSGESSPVLADGFIRVTGTTARVAPVPIRAAQVITQPGEFTNVLHGDELVQIEGEVVESRSEAAQRIWTLQQDGKVFEAYLPSSAVDERIDDVGVGSVLRLTGICAVHADFDRNPTSFSLLLRNSDDIVVLRRMSWWTARHLFLVVAVLTVAVAAAVLWVTLLRVRVKQMTRAIVASEQRFRYLAAHDGLTGLDNRNSILATLGESLEEAARDGDGVCVAIVDLDHFKRINDTYGHPAGDEVLREAARRLSSSIRGTDAIGRYGGEEFLIVFGNLDEAVCRDRCELVRLAVSGEPVVFEREELAISCSIGIAGTRGSGIAADKLIANADEALYNAKKSGRDRVELFAPESERLADVYEQQQGYFELPLGT